MYIYYVVCTYVCMCNFGTLYIECVRMYVSVCGVLYSVYVGMCHYGILYIWCVCMHVSLWNIMNEQRI